MAYVFHVTRCLQLPPAAKAVLSKLRVRSPRMNPMPDHAKSPNPADLPRGRRAFLSARAPTYAGLGMQLGYGVAGDVYFRGNAWLRSSGSACGMWCCDGSHLSFASVNHRAITNYIGPQLFRTITI